MDLITGLSGLHRNSPRVLNISTIRVFDLIRDPEIPITLRPQIYMNIISALRKIFGPKRDDGTGEWRRLHNRELHDLYGKRDIMRIVKFADCDGQGM